jgi:arylsulfatase A-like enzyme
MKHFRAWLVLALGFAAGVSTAGARPNIVLIFADDLGWKDVGWNNDGGFIETPHLDGGRAGLATNRAVELYNLATDPGERTDLADREIRRREELLGDLLAWLEKTRAPFPTKR